MEIAAIIAGVATILVAFLPGRAGTERAVCLLVGASAAGYGVYVLNQTSGTFYFPVAVFALPIGLIAKASMDSWRDRSRTENNTASTADSTKHGDPGEELPASRGYQYFEAKPFPQQWAADPSGRNEWRYWDGVRWTDYVANAGMQWLDPVGRPNSPMRSISSKTLARD